MPLTKKQSAALTRGWARRNIFSACGQLGQLLYGNQSLKGQLHPHEIEEVQQAYQILTSLRENWNNTPILEKDN